MINYIIINFLNTTIYIIIPKTLEMIHAHVRNKGPKLGVNTKDKIIRVANTIVEINAKLFIFWWPLK